MWCASTLMPTPEVVQSHLSGVYFEFLVIILVTKQPRTRISGPRLVTLNLLMFVIWKGKVPFSVETRFNTDCIDTDVECERFLRDVKSYLDSWHNHLSVTIVTHVLGALSTVYYVVFARTMAWYKTLLRIIHMRPHWVETLSIRELWILQVSHILRTQ